MAWRKWFVRSVVFGVVGCCAGAFSLYQQWTNPAAVREQVLAKLKVVFPGARASVDSARLRLLGGIQVQELRLARVGDADNVDLAHIPSAILYHDKEKILEGELMLRKVEFFRPRLRAYRNPDGTWNLQGILGVQRLDRYLPTIVVHQGTLLLEDRAISGSVNSLEINDVNLILINDPLPTVTFEGAAQSPLVGKVTLSGSFQRATGEVALHVATVDTPLTAKLLQRLTPWCPKNSLQNLDIAGQADFDAKVHLQPKRQQVLHYEIGCQIRKTKVTHPILPMALEEVQGRVKIVDGIVTLEDGQAKSGATLVKVRGQSQFPCLEQTFEAHLDIQNLPLSDEIHRRLPEKTQELIHLFRPEGNVSMKLDLARREGQWVEFEPGRESTITIMPERASANLTKFPYPLREITGSIDFHLVNKRSQFNLIGKAGGQPVVIRGRTQGSGPEIDVSAEIQAANVPIDETLLKALPQSQEKLARSFRAVGLVDARAVVRHRPGEKIWDNEFHLGFRDATLLWDAFPLPISQVQCRLNVFPNRWELAEFRGTHDRGVIQAQGKSVIVPGKDKPGFLMEIQGTDVALNEALHNALEPMPPLKNAWHVFQPSGRMTFTAQIHRPTEEWDDLEVRVQAQGATFEPRFFPTRMTDLRGIAHYQKRKLELAQVSARNGGARWVLPAGQIDLRPGGGFHADLPDLDIQDLVLNPGLLQALPVSLRSAAEALQCRDPLRVKTRVVIDQVSDIGSVPDIYWNGQAWLKNAKLAMGVALEDVTGVFACRGRHNGTKLLGLEGNVLLERATLFKQPINNAQAHFHIQESAPEVLLAGLSIPQFGGDITGELRVDFTSTLRYELNLTAAQIDLQQFGKHNLGPNSQIEGKAVGRLHLIGTSAGIASLEGNGSFDVIGGKLYNLPLILDLLKFLGLRWPDRTAFEEVHALFRIRGPRVSMRRLNLQGNAVSLTGQGDFNLDGTDLQLDFYPTWARIDQLLPPALRNVPPAVSKNFLVIEMRGKVGTQPDDLKFSKKAVPFLVDPLLNMRDRMIGQKPADRNNEPISQRPPAPILGAQEPR